MDWEFATYLVEQASRDGAMVATVIASKGSAPRRFGAVMLTDSDGNVMRGTIGGGQLEHQVSQAMAAETKRQRLAFHLVRDLAMCCGGQVEVFVQPAADFAGLTLSPQPSGLHLFVNWAGDVSATDAPCGLMADGFVVDVVVAPRLFLFGYGHVAKPVAAFAKACGFDVIVCDDNETGAIDDLAGAVPSFALSDIERGCGPIRPTDYVVVMTRDHAIDQKIVETLASRELAYLGVIGSRGKAARFRKRLLAKGLGEAQIDRMRMPLGLDIGARTPEEIAVSVVGELIAKRHEVS